MLSKMNSKYDKYDLDKYFTKDLVHKINFRLLLHVRDQLRTQSCVTFCVVECIYVYQMLKYGFASKMSEQPYVDHFKKKAPKIAEGLKFFINVGVVEEKLYPWGSRRQPPRYDMVPRFYIKDYEIILGESHEDVHDLLDANTPVIGVVRQTHTIVSLLEFEQSVWRTSEEERYLYFLTPEKYCPPHHAVTVIAYGFEKQGFFKKVPFYTVKNSWGKECGHGGFRESTEMTLHFLLK